MARAVQKFTAEYLKQSRNVPPDSIVEFLDSFRRLHAPRQGTKLISMKVDVPLLTAFKFEAERLGRPYQRIIKDLMREWLMTGSRIPPE